MQNPNQEAWEEFDAMVEEENARRTILVKLAMLPDDLAALVAAQFSIPRPEMNPQRWN